ncbi:P-loop containing nucleoside triphosphate hydrolase protein [Exophiala viscosa]|uniref:P-loop containing nucleoside triphosphate hydrolase protein n=1 Tax=Exophiala viscosa TaxID=2486360 RepID=UPI002192B861|nr:P-loop containing nucleoside triphosphate hydrolase protein [Exophiala viscosa]
MGKLIRLELFNFKSYKGHHILLFGDAYFTSIIGPNGSGKSNSMDAISFVLGIKSSHIRSTHLRELVYRGRVLKKSTANGETQTNGANGHDEEDGSQVNGTQERNDPKSAWVMAWKRTITNQGVSEYRINERVEENILIKARNFLVFQGDKPQDLTRLIEQAEYDQLKAELDAAAETQAFQLHRRRGINSEIRQYQEQKKEADNFQKKAAERDQAIVTHSSAEIQKHQNDLKEFRRGIEKYERNLDAAKKEHAQVARAIKAKEKEIEDKSSSLVPIDEQISVSNQQLTKYANRVNSIVKELSQLEKDLATWQKQWEQNANRLGGQLSDADLQQYTRLREELNKRASADLTPIEATVDSTEYKLQSLENEYGAVNERRDALKEIDGKKKDLHNATSKRLQAARTRTELDEKLAEADDGRRTTEKESRMKETIAMLKRTYPGVKGRKKYQEAVSTVLGRHFDAVVQCIEYLRDHRSGQATFIPLDTIQGMRPAIETVDYDQSVARAISYACGNSIDLSVTLDGSVIHKGGLMTGGRGREQNTRRWDDAEEFVALPQERSRTELSGLESRLRYAKEELDALTKNLQSKKREIDHRPKMQAELRKLEKLDEDISDYQESVNNVENEHGFDDIRDYEARQGSLQQEAAQKKLEIEGQLNDRLAALRDREQRDKETIDDLNEQRQGIQNDLDTLKGDLDELHAELDQQKEILAQAAETLAKQKQEVQKRTISALEGEMQRHSSSRYSLLRRCKIENIAIPLEEGSASLDNADTMDVDEDDPTSSALKAYNVADYGIEPDFDALDDDLKDEDNDDTEAKLLDDITKLNAALDKMQPNAHAAQRLATVEGRARDTEQEYEDSRNKYRGTKAQFEETMEKRNELFNKAFSHISEQIEPIYSNLTKSEEFPAGGRAYLTADEEEPYLAGVNYHTMPPTKRFRDMEHLSGGEKTMAALALLFAIHSYQPSPFFVLDEVDAALDNANVGKLVNYVRNHAGPGMQFIVISLKTGFFQGSEALVGVYRDQGANSSKVLTLDLRKYS